MKSRMTRRAFLQSSTAAGLGLAAGCSPAPSPGVIFKGWVYEPDLVRENLDYFEQQTGIAVDYNAVSGNYHDKMVALHVGGAPMECCYVRDDDFAEWVEAGWLRPCDDLLAADPETSATTADIFSYNLSSMMYGGKRYGLPYYTDFSIWVYNEPMLEAAGFDAPARTLDELTEQAIKVREARVRTPNGDLIEYPITLNFRQSVLGFNDWWTLNYASEASLFDDGLNPLFPDDEGRRAEKILQWVTDGIQRHRIISPTSLTVGQIREHVASGRQVYGIINKYDLEWVNNRRNSAAADDELKRRGSSDLHAKVYRMAPVPSISAEQTGTLGWTRMYCLTSRCREDRMQDAWDLMKFLGAKDAAGDYYTARRWFRLRGLGFAYRSLLDDPDVIAQTEQWGEIDKIREQALHVRPRENIKAPWFPDFKIYYQPEIQKVLLGQQSPRDGLARIARRCRQLISEWS